MRQFCLCLFFAAVVCLAFAHATAWAQATPVKVLEYKVQQGDTTGAIAEYFYGDQTKAKMLATHNGLSNVNRISVGQVLEVPYFDWVTWRAYAERVGIPVDAEPAAPVSGGSADAMVAAPIASDDGDDSGRTVWIVVYTVAAILMAGGLYWRSRRHTHLTLGAGPVRK